MAVISFYEPLKINNMCQAKLKDQKVPTFKSMLVVYNESVIKVDFNAFEIKSTKNFRVKTISEKPEMINFASLKALEPSDKAYLDYVRKEYGLIAVKQIQAQKNVEKKLSTRRAEKSR